MIATAHHEPAHTIMNHHSLPLTVTNHYLLGCSSNQLISFLVNLLYMVNLCKPTVPGKQLKVNITVNVFVRSWVLTHSHLGLSVNGGTSNTMVSRLV